MSQLIHSLRQENKNNVNETLVMVSVEYIDNVKTCTILGKRNCISKCSVIKMHRDIDQ